MEPSHHISKISFYTRTINQGRPNDDNLHTRFFRNNTQCVFGFFFGNTIGIGWGRLIVSGKRLIEISLLPIYLYGTDENKTLNSRCGSLPSKIDCAFNINLPELG
ncbi:hypothetical protein D3C71_1744450 [compost metagenome]